MFTKFLFIVCVCLTPLVDYSPAAGDYGTEVELCYDIDLKIPTGPLKGTVNVEACGETVEGALKELGEIVREIAATTTPLP